MSATQASSKVRKRFPKRSTMYLAPLLVAGILGFLVYGLIEPEPETYADPVAAETTATNTAIAGALLAAGIGQPFVDAQGDRIYIAYDRPQDAAVAAEDWQRFALGAAADHAMAGGTVVVVQHEGGAASLIWSVEADDLIAFMAGDMEAEAFEDRIEASRA